MSLFDVITVAVAAFAAGFRWHDARGLSIALIVVCVLTCALHVVADAMARAKR